MTHGLPIGVTGVHNFLITITLTESLILSNDAVLFQPCPASCITIFGSLATSDVGEPQPSIDSMLILLWSAFGVFSQLAFVRLFSTTAGETAYYGNVFFIVAIFALSCGFFARRLAQYYHFLPAILLVNYFAILWLGNHYLLQRMPEEFQWGSYEKLDIVAADFDLQLAVLILCSTLAPALLLIGAKAGRTHGAR